MIEPFKELLFSLMDKRLEALERDVSFLSLEVDKLMQKRKRQDGYLNDVDKERVEELQRKIAARDKTEEDISIDLVLISKTYASLSKLFFLITFKL